MINKNISTDYGVVSSTAEITYSDNGQVLLHIVSSLGTATHEHMISVGAEDGNDSVGSLSEADLQTTLQQHLDDKRNEAAQVLAGRAKVAKIAANLV